jgi:hypothetical protein
LARTTRTNSLAAAGLLAGLDGLALAVFVGRGVAVAAVVPSVDVGIPAVDDEGEGVDVEGEEVGEVVDGTCTAEAPATALPGSSDPHATSVRLTTATKPAFAVHRRTVIRCRTVLRCRTVIRRRPVMAPSSASGRGRY